MSRLTVEMLDVLTGYRGTYETEIPAEDEDIMVYMFEDGNYACDCNRKAFLYDVNPFGPLEIPCSHREIVVLSLRIDGEEHYSEAR